MSALAATTADGVRRRLRKLRGRTLAELRERGLQALAAYRERLGLSAEASEMSADEFWRALDDGDCVGSGDDAERDERLLDRFRASAPRPLPGLEDVRATVAELRDGWPGAESRALAAADRAVAGHFDLLGYRDLDFGTPIDWHVDPVAGRRAPFAHWSRIEYLNPGVVGDHKVVWELNRHQHFVLLGRAYWYSGDERYAEAFARQLESWMDANPPKQGVNWASSLEVALRAISWVWALHLFRDSSALTPTLFRRALGFLHRHGTHLERFLSTYFSPNTHLTGEALGLFYLGTCLPQFARARHWRATGRRVLATEITRQVRADGVYVEQATYYQRYTADFYLHALLLGRRCGAPFDDAVGARVEALLEHLMYLTRPDGRAPLIGDDDGGRLLPLDDRPTDDFRAPLATGALLFDRADFAFVAGPPSEELAWLLGPGALGRYRSQPVRPPSLGSRAFRDGGVYVMRDGWGPDADFAVVDCGPHGLLNCGHAHADALAFELAAHGRPFLVDPGTYTYTAEPAERQRFRSAAAHNALTVDGESSSVPDGAFTWKSIARSTALSWHSHARLDFFEGTHDGFGRLPAPATHFRSLLFVKQAYWVLRDRVTSAGVHEVAVHFQCASGVAAHADGDAAVTLVAGAACDGPALRVVAFGRGTFRVGDGWVSPVYGARERAPSLAFTSAPAEAHDIVTFLLPARVDAGGVRVEEIDASAGRAFALESRESLDLLLLEGGIGDPPLRTAGGVATDAAWAWVRRPRRGAPVAEFILLRGGRLEVDGEVLAAAERTATCIVGRRSGGEFVVEWCGPDEAAPVDAPPVSTDGNGRPGASRDPYNARRPASSLSE